MGRTDLDKYEAIGNDFLVLIDRGGADGVGEARADDGSDSSAFFNSVVVASICDRHRGVGADGVIRLSSQQGNIKMELRNADGGIAETSGNGLRCAALAARRNGLVASDCFSILTDAGLVDVTILPSDQAGEALVTVGMGRAQVSPLESSPLPGTTAFRVDVGNPHLVLLGSGEGPVEVDLDVIGPKLEGSVPGGTNVEIITTTAPDELRLAVWERGVGRTLACGSGSVASAAAARLSGRVGDRVVVLNPGGPLVVELKGAPDHPAVSLRGPARHVARVSVELDELEWHGGLLVP